MVAVTLGLGFGLLVTAAALLFYVGRLFTARARTAADPLGLRVFALFWYTASIVIGVIASQNLLVAGGLRSIEVLLALSYLLNVPLAVALWSLLYYLLLVYTGRSRLAVPLGLLYGAYFVYLTWYRTVQAPYQLIVTDWDVRIASVAGVSDPLALTYAVLFGGPILIAVFAYGSLYFRVQEPTLRYRIATVTLSFLVLFGAIVVSLAARLERFPWFPLTYEIPILVAALGVVAAYRPPGWLRRRLRVEGMEAGA